MFAVPRLGIAISLAILALNASAWAVRVPKDSILPFFYPKEAVEAVFGQTPPELAATLEAHRADVERSGKGDLVAASYELLLVHKHVGNIRVVIVDDVELSRLLAH